MGLLEVSGGYAFFRKRIVNGFRQAKKVDADNRVLVEVRAVRCTTGSRSASPEHEASAHLTFGADNILTKETHAHEMKNIKNMGFDCGHHPDFEEFLAECDLLPDRTA